MKLPEIIPHQKGEHPELEKKPNYLLTDDTKLAVDTFGGRVHVEWDQIFPSLKELHIPYRKRLTGSKGGLSDS